MMCTRGPVARWFAVGDSNHQQTGLRGPNVLASFQWVRYRARMPDDKLTPASPRDVETCLSLGLTSGRSLARTQAAEVTAKVVAERLVNFPDLEAAASDALRRLTGPIPAAGAGDNPGRRGFER